MSELDFPELETAAPAASTAIAEQPAGAVDLTKLDLQAVALAQFNTSHAAVKTAREKLDGVVHDLSTPGKLADAKSLRHRLIGQPLAEARKISAGLKSKLTAVSKAVGAELAAVETAFEEADALLSPQIAKREEELAEEKRIAAEKEAARVQKHRDNLAKLAEPAERCKQPGMTSERIANGIAAVSAIVIDREAWEEFADQAEEQKVVTLERMQKLLADAQADEERERAAAALKAEQERLAAERAEIERARAELQAQQEAAAAAERARAEEAARLEREQREEAERQALELQEARERAERAEADAARAAQEKEAKRIERDGDHEAAQRTSLVDYVPPPAPAPDVVQLHAAPAALEPHMLKLGELWDILGLSDREAFLAGLGFAATPASKGTAKLYAQSALPSICLRMSEHFAALAGKQQKAA